VLTVGFQRVGLFFFSWTQFPNRECGHLSAQKLDQPDDITDQRPRHRPTGRECGLRATVFAANALLSSLGEEPTRRPVGVRALHAETANCIILLRG
jgi:hypothetical protein